MINVAIFRAVIPPDPGFLAATIRINLYLQALLTKSEIELKLSQCKIQ